MKRALLFAFFMFQCGIAARGQSADPFYFSLRSGPRFPLFEPAGVLSIGLFNDLSMEYSLPFLPPLSVRATAGYALFPIDSAAGDLVHTIEGAVGAGFRVPLFGKFNGLLVVEGGYYYAPISDPAIEPGRNIWIAASAGMEFSLSPAFRLGVLGDYRKYFDFHDSAGLCFSLVYRPIGLRRLEIQQMQLEEIFPILLKAYDTKPLGRVTLRNTGNLPVEELKVSFLVSRYMDEPKVCPAPQSLGPGQSVEVQLFALFSPEVLSITEDNTKAPAKVVVSYTQQGKPYTQESIQSLSFFNRNAIVWDDDRKAAAYVTAKDPAVLEVSNNVISWSRGLVPIGFDRNLAAAMAVHELLGVMGIAYVIDPNTPFEDIHQDRGAVDYLKFPRQTLNYGAGDCDDLSILYSALLESVAVDTAFITVPGHIYIAFALDTPPEEALKRFLFPEDIIVTGGKAWVPFEVTLPGKDFALAWETGARQWRQQAKSGQAAFLINRESWSTYGSIGFLEGSSQISLPARSSFQKSLTTALKSFIEREVAPRVAQLQAQISRSKGLAQDLNRLGVLYARYGLLEEAKKQFEKILEKQDYPTALVNLGSIQLLEGNLEAAERSFKRLYDRQVRIPVVLLQLARVAYGRNDFAKAREYHAELRGVDPKLAGEVEYLARIGQSEARASAAESQEAVIWIEE